MNPDELPHSRTHGSQFLAGVLTRGLKELVANAGSARFEVACIGDKMIPLVVNESLSTECYLFSPYAHYIRYVARELKKMPRSPASVFAKAATRLVGAASALTRFNRCVSVNNWLFSTNPLPALGEDEIRALNSALRERFPDLAIVYRTVHEQPSDYRGALRSSECRFVINRPIHYWDPTTLARIHPGKRGNIHRDIRLLETGGFVVRQEREASHQVTVRLAALYRKLYIEKHSPFNADFRPAFFDLVIRSGVKTIRSLFWRDERVAFVASFVDSGMIVPTIIGYDTDLDFKGLGLYRAVMALLFRDSMTTGQPLFLSTGASSFKMNRGSVERLEYEAVFDRHLGAARRLPWTLVKRMCEAFTSGLDTARL